MKYERVLMTAGAAAIAAVFAVQVDGQAPAKASAPASAKRAIPRMADGHPDLTGLWNALADNLLGVPNQMHNVGIEVGADSARDTVRVIHTSGRRRSRRGTSRRSACSSRHLGGLLSVRCIRWVRWLYLIQPDVGRYGCLRPKC